MINQEKLNFFIEKNKLFIILSLWIFSSIFFIFTFTKNMVSHQDMECLTGIDTIMAH